ncbi:MAG TPA: hypothetical protein VD927_18865 [Chryseosolibacter sp.]|nr:hypothetical protein [Chryseosolibacter sp.]
MKRIGLIWALCSVAVLSFAQHGHGTVATSLTEGDRLSLVKTSIDLPSWHEKTFWPVYESYLQKMKESSASAYRTLTDLSSLSASSEDEINNTAENLFAFRYQEFAHMKEYYQRIGAEFNGVIALQFLQTEVMIDMVETSKIYDRSNWRSFKYYPTGQPYEQFIEGKHNTMEKALSIPADKVTGFWSLYSKYEEDSNAYLGENYDMLSQYAGAASDYTPALAKRLGYGMLNVLERDIKLKEKYYKQMHEQFGASVAADFLAWEDYFSLLCKMHSWVEAN